MAQKTFKEALQNAWDALLSLVAINLLWLILTLLIFPAFPAYAGLNFATNKIANGEPAGVKNFFDGFKKYFWVSWRFGLINIVVYSLIALNIRFLSHYEGLGYILLQYFFLSVSLLWSMLQVYVFPLLLEQDEPSVYKGLWNSIVIYLNFPARSLGFCLLIFGVLAISFIVPPLLVLISVSFLVYLSNWQAIWVIKEIGVKSNQ